MKISTKDLGKVLKLKGYIRSVSQKKSFLFEGLFECSGRTCQGEQVVQFDFSVTDKIKIYCQSESCSVRKAMDLIPDDSTFIDVEYAVLQGEDTARLQFLDIVLPDKLVGKVLTGDYVEIEGILGQRKTKTPGNYRFFLEVRKVKQLDKQMASVKFSEDDVKEFKKIASQKDYIKTLIEPLAPHLNGLDFIKEILITALVASPPTDVGDKNIRGDIHVLLLGPPSTGKSELVWFASKKIIHRGVYVSGKSSTGVGLTAAAVKDIDGKWTIEAGLLPFADGAIAAVDEFNQLDPTNKSSLHEAMEQQTVSVAKAGVTATLSTRCGVLAAANPKLGHWDKFEDRLSQFDISSTLLSRFDVIIAMEEFSDEDGYTASHILDVFQDVQKETLPCDILRKYIAYARKNINPSLSNEARDLIDKYYKKLLALDKARDGEHPLILPRQLLSLIRLTRASARLRLSETAETKDAKKAIEIYEYSMETMGIAPDQNSLDVLMVGDISEQKKERDQDVFIKIIQALEENDPDELIPRSDIMFRCNEVGITKEKTVKLLRLFTDPKNEVGYFLMEPQNNKYRLVDNE